MKTLIKPFPASANDNKKIIKKLGFGVFLKITAATFLLSALSIFPSCVLWVPVPRPQRNVIIVEQKGHHDNGGRRYYKSNNGQHKGNQKEHKGRR